MSGSNVVPLPMPAPQQSVWPMPSMMPVPGCCPPGGMDALMKCYCDIQAATQFICAVMVDCINTNPAVAEAMIAAIEKSGSSLPMIGVTDGSDAQPGQVGEWVRFTVDIPYGTTSQTTPFSAGVLPPGDWDVWSLMEFNTYIGGSQYVQTPVPPGFSDALFAATETVGGPVGLVLISAAVRASVTVPSLLAFSAIFNGQNTIPSGGTAHFIVSARRRR